MRTRLFASWVALLATASLASAQELPQTIPAPTAVPYAPTYADCPDGNCGSRGFGPAGANPFWANAEYLMWWVKSGPLPIPLVATGSTSDPLPGALNQPGTSVVYGNTNTDFGKFSGLRIGAGIWLDPEETFGIEGRGFLLEHNVASFSASSDHLGNPVLTVPVFNVVTGLGERFTIADPALRSGRIDITSSNRLWGAEANAALGLVRNDSLRITGLVGFRYLDMLEQFESTITSSALATGPGNNNVIFGGAAHLAPAGVIVTDAFQTRNQFYGGQIGARADYTLGRIYAGAAVRVALGDTHQVIDNAGVSSLTMNGVPAVTSAYGRLVGPTNAGSFSADTFSVVPEVELKAGVRIVGGLKAFVGYNFLYWSGVVRPGNEISTVVDTRPFPTSVIYQPSATPAVPAVSFTRSDFWAHGINFGLQLDF